MQHKLSHRGAEEGCQSTHSIDQKSRLGDVKENCEDARRLQKESVRVREPRTEGDCVAVLLEYLHASSPKGKKDTH